MTMEPPAYPDFSLKACYAKAWKAFAKWWIPICLIAGVLMLFEFGPKQLAKAESSTVGKTIAQIIAAFEQNDLERVEELAIELNKASLAYAKIVVTFTLYAAPIVAILTILLLCASVMAVKDQRIRYSPGHILWVAFANLLVATGKVLLLFLFLPLGIYLYIKLYFVSLAMIEEQQGLIGAIKRSWHLSYGHFWPLLGIVAINGTLQLAMVPTLVGLVPASGFANTARAAAFELLRAGKPFADSTRC
ncbi:MAG: hypothetical protein KAU94_04900 [Verrucomicrobia bacterium]|nr:hypothetical protein [Verrucomicrobiota bacterium]